MERPAQRPYWRDDVEQGAVEAFQDQHGTFADRIERMLMRCVILGLVALALSQGLQLNRFTRLAALEGVPVHEVTDWSRSPASEGDQATARGRATSAGALTLKVVSVTRRSAPGVRLLVDGKPAGDFAAGSVSVAVKPGQVLSVDGSEAAEPLTFRVVEVAGLASPELGTAVTTRGDRQNLGVARASGQ